MPTRDKRTAARYFAAGAFSGVVSVLITYPMELIRVRMAFQTKASERTSLREAIKSIYHENHPLSSVSSSTSSAIPRKAGVAAMATTVPASAAGASAGAVKSTLSSFTRSIPLYPFYRGFSISIVGMIPYAGVSFLTYGTLKQHAPKWFPSLLSRPSVNDLVCGGAAGLVSQTASYPFEVIRRRMQVGGARGGNGLSWKDAVRAIRAQRGWRGFFIGLTIGYVKVVPMSR